MHVSKYVCMYVHMWVQHTYVSLRHVCINVKTCEHAYGMHVYIFMHHIYIFNIMHMCVLWYLHQRFQLNPKVSFGNARPEYICSLSFLVLNRTWNIYCHQGDCNTRTKLIHAGTHRHTQTHTMGFAIVQSSSSSEPSYSFGESCSIWTIYLSPHVYHSWLVYYTTHWRVQIQGISTKVFLPTRHKISKAKRLLQPLHIITPLLFPSLMRVHNKPRIWLQLRT